MPLRYCGLQKTKATRYATRPPNFSGPPASALTMRPAAFLGSAFLKLGINTSTGRSSTYGFARSWRSKTAYRIGWLKFSTTVFRDLSKPKER